MVAFPTGGPHVRRTSFLPSWFVPNPNIVSGPNKSPSSCGKQQHPLDILGYSSHWVHLVQKKERIFVLLQDPKFEMIKCGRYHFSSFNQYFPTSNCSLLILEDLGKRDGERHQGHISRKESEEGKMFVNTTSTLCLHKRQKITR